jgi:hypothetical protein
MRSRRIGRPPASEQNLCLGAAMGLGDADDDVPELHKLEFRTDDATIAGSSAAMTRCWQTVLLKPHLRADIRECLLSTS